MSLESTVVDNGMPRGLLNYGVSNDGDLFQWVGNNTPQVRTAEHKLMWRMLEDAVDIANQTLGFGKFTPDVIRKRLRERDAAREWISEPESDWIFSFTNVCETLGFDPDYLRKGIEVRWR